MDKEKEFIFERACEIINEMEVPRFKIPHKPEGEIFCAGTPSTVPRAPSFNELTKASRPWIPRAGEKPAEFETLDRSDPKWLSDEYVLNTSEHVLEKTKNDPTTGLNATSCGKAVEVPAPTVEDRSERPAHLTPKEWLEVCRRERIETLARLGLAHRDACDAEDRYRNAKLAVRGVKMERFVDYMRDMQSIEEHVEARMWELVRERSGQDTRLPVDNDD